MLKLGLAAVFAVASIVFMPISGSAADRHAGYYYPAPQSQETYIARAQTLPALFRENAVQDYFTFFDLAKMTEFELITVSDGFDFAHQTIVE